MGTSLHEFAVEGDETFFSGELAITLTNGME
jgi:hypothetical protein